MVRDGGLVTAVDSRRGSHAALLCGYEVLVAVLLFGDYLALTLSRALTGTAGNWILCTAVLQALVLGGAGMLGRFRGRWSVPLLLGYLGVVALMLGHVLVVALAGNELDSYAEQKVFAATLLLGPSLLCGMALGRHADLPGRRLGPALLVPLLVMCLVAVMTDPRQLTIAYFDALPVWFGFLVMPAHQGLACSLAKGAVAGFAMASETERGRRGKILVLSAVGVLVGLALLSGARSYAFALLAALAVQLLGSRRRLPMVALGTIVAVALFANFAPDLVYERFDLQTVSDTLAYREREDAWSAAWATFLANPWVGAGPGGFARAMNYGGRVYPHNLVLEIASELGILGLIAFGLMVVPVVLRCGSRLLRQDRLDPRQSFCFGLLTFGLLGAMSVGDIIRNHFVFLGLGMAATAFLPAARGASARVGRRVVKPQAKRLEKAG